jgi:superfamily II helicase
MTTIQEFINDGEIIELKRETNICNLDNFIINGMCCRHCINNCQHKVIICEKTYILSGRIICYIMKELGYENEISFQQHFKNYELKLNEELCLTKEFIIIDEIIAKLKMPINPLK